MTYQKPTFDPSAGPTPEEISARLEALLKRTHELRRAQPKPRTGGAPDEGPTWPPSDRDMAAVEVVDVPGSRFSGQGTIPHAGAAARPEPTGQPPDWKTLRLRDTPPSAPTTKTPAWVWPVIAVLAGALTVETGYLLWTAPWHVAPVAAVTVPPPDAPVETATELPAEPPTAAQAEPAQPSSATPAAPTVPAPTGTGDEPGATSATTGAVRIESDPPGAVVTMGGRERGVTPITVGQLRPGRHDVIVVRPGAARLELKVDITAGQTTTLDASGRPPVQR